MPFKRKVIEPLPPDYGLPKQKNTVVLMTATELLQVLDILEDICQEEPQAMKKLVALKEKFKKDK